MRVKEEKKLKKLYSSLRIGKKKSKNRIVSTAHATGFNDNGILNEKHLRYLERKAEGGAGIIMAFGSASVYKESSASYGSVSLWNTENESYLKDLADRVHAHNALLISQATHMGRRATSLVDGRPVHAPSAIPEGVHQEIPHVMRTEEITAIVDAFVDSAKRLEKCGWDGIEITSFGGHLIEQFWSPKINNRTDKYGGDFEGRMRFSIEVINAVSEVVSDDFIICFRMTGDPKTHELGLDQYDLLKIAKRLDELNCIDLFNISGGTGANFLAQSAVVPGDTYKRGTFNHLAREMKKILSVPVLAAGRILDPIQAEHALERGDCDLVAMTRAIIADPELPNLAKEGRFSRIRPCIACNEGCIGRVYSGLPMICTVNPSIADITLENANFKALNSRRIVIVGGGPAGMEAARVSAMRGHDVSILEINKNLGGKVPIASLASERPHYGRHNEWLKKELTRLGVKIYCNKSGTLTNILNLNPDVVIIAKGAKDVNPFKDINDGRFATDIDILQEKVRVDSETKVLVYDREGVYRGASIANFIAQKGVAQVEIVSPLWSICENLDEMRKAEMYRLLATNNVKLLPNKKLILEDNLLTIVDLFSNKKRPVKNELIVLVGFEEGENKLYEDLKKILPEIEVHQIGDVVSPRRLHDSIYEGAKIGSKL